MDLTGITAHYLTTDTYRVGEGDVVLMHAAAGGVGQMVTQMAEFKDATVIGTTSTEEKARIAGENGADHVFGWIASGALRVSIGGTYAISDVTTAFSALEERKTTGKIVLTH